ncbi:MAG: long-chain fatty acid--CoA ligase [bacterium]|nr:long-chain fatty acid--CoA ligase [bacterium]
MNHYGLDTAQNLAKAFYDMANAHPERIVYSQAQYDGTLESKNERRWVATNYEVVKSRINKIAALLKIIGVKKGTRVAIISSSRPEWMEADFAILACGGVSISIYQTLPDSDVAYILYDSEAEIVFAENEEQVSKLISINNKDWNIAGTEDRDPLVAKISIKKIIVFEECIKHDLLVQFSSIVSATEAQNPIEIASIQRNDLASFVYTSGTTGPPKGVMQTHGNHLSNVRQARDAEFYQDDSSLMLFLPLAHSFAKLMGYVGFLTPATLKFAAIVDTKTSKLEPVSITRDIREGSASIVPIVPRLLEKMRDGVMRQTEKPGLAGSILKLTIESAVEIYEKGEKASFKAKLFKTLLAGIRRKIQLKLFGAHFKCCVSGGAKLPVPVGRFFDALGIEILEGYGLTETCVATNANRLGNKKVGTVGPVLSTDIEMKILDDGEVCFRGPNISLGYHNRVKATQSSWDKDGWFRTGDLGILDSDKFLTITGRKKELIITSNGKKIAPNEIEDRLKSCPYISQIIMVGEGRPFCGALLTLNEEAIKYWAKSQGKQLMTPLDQDKSVRNLIWSYFEKVNEKLPNFEQIKKIAVLPGDFTIDNGLLTPTFKVKRKLVEERFKENIEALY